MTSGLTENGAAGWYIDDVCVESKKAGDLVLVGVHVDGTPEPGESIRLSFDLYNNSEMTYTDVRAHLDAPNTGVTIAVGEETVEYGILEPGETVSLSNVVTLVLSDDGSLVVDPAELMHNILTAEGYTGLEIALLDLLLDVVDPTNTFQVASSSGVVNWLGEPLPGVGGDGGRYR